MSEERPVGLGDHGAQAAQIARNLDAALAAVGATRDDIVDETVYVVGYTPELLPAIFGPLRAGVAKAPASTLVGVSALFAPEFLLEVKVVAALPGQGGQDRAEPADATEAGASTRAHAREGTQTSKPLSPAGPGRTRPSPRHWNASPWRPWRRWGYGWPRGSRCKSGYRDATRCTTSSRPRNGRTSRTAVSP
ncbi:RidA family protein [Streptomyces sp. NPDC057340]|uniref:RidA family protein n=1 Tax=Streptomyces sp. NPDC057340 TaxID=3346103 RepID=UPI00362A5A8E